MAYDFDVVRVIATEHMGAFEVTDAMKASGWVGGKWVKYHTMQSWADANEIRWKRVVTPAGPEDPMCFVLRASYEGTDHFTGHYPQKTGIVTCCLYGQYLFKYFETDNLAERTVPGSGSPLVYTLNTNLFVSSNGLLTSEKESGINSRGVGFCVGLPADNNGYLGAEILIGPW